MMRTIHLIAALDPAAGGPPRVAMELAAAQAALPESEVRLMAVEPTADAQATTRQAIAEARGLDRVRVVWLPRSSIAAQKQVMREQLIDADHLHVHGVWEPVLRRACRTARAMGVGYAIRPAGMLDPWSLAQKRWKKRLALSLGYKRMLDGAAFIHALNADEARLIEPLKLRSPIEVVPNGVFPSMFDELPPAGTFRALRPELGAERFVLFLSRLHYKKGLDILAAAWAEVAKTDGQTMLVVAGPDGGAREDFLRRITAAGLEDRVHVIGPIYGREKYAALIDAACFCLPSRQEGFSVAITEALAAGCAVVVTDACHFPEVAEVGAGVVTTLEPASVAAGIREVLRDDVNATAMGAAGQRLVRERFTWPIIAELLTGLIKKYHASPASGGSDVKG